MVNYRALFFSGVEHGFTREEVNLYREKYGSEFKLLGFDVKDPSLGKDIENIPKDRLIKEDEELLKQSHITVIYAPKFSEGIVREAKWAKENKQLVYGFTDKNNTVPEQLIPFIDGWFTDFDKLKTILEIYLFPIGEYFTNAHTNNINGDIFLYGMDIHQVAPHHLHKLLENSNKRKNIFYFCCEKSHIHELAQKLPTALRLGKVNDIYILTKDGSPHDIQMHTLTEEVAENISFQGNVHHYVVEKGRLHKISKEAVRKSRHLSEIEQY